MTEGRAAALLPLLLVCGLLILLGAVGCAPSAEERAADRDEIERFLGEYLPKMAEAYRTGETDPLDPYAAEKEQEAIKKRVRERAKQGMILAPELRSVQVEDVRTWSAVNAYVTTVEVWDLRVLASGSEEVLRQELGQSNRVKYQLKREGDRWRVFWRQLEQSFDE
ncbi:MAG: IMS domain-containing protein [Acidobacteriota bacterium]